MEGLLERVRIACREVAERARLVRINTGQIHSYASSLSVEQDAAPKFDPAYHYIGSARGTVAYVLTLDAINFGSGYSPHLRKRVEHSGYFTIASALRERFAATGPFTAPELAHLTPEDCAAVFGQDMDDGPRGELMARFASALNCLGQHLVDRFDGSFVDLVEAAGGSADGLVRTLAAMPYFRDVALYEGFEVPLYKRAQMAAADLSMAFDGKGYGFFSDLDRLTVFADNAVPHVLRVDGILDYEVSLASRIDAGELIPPGSPEEVEIRAVAVHAAELIVGRLRDVGRDVTPMQLDHLLWHRAKHPPYCERPRHRTLTIFY